MRHLALGFMGLFFLACGGDSFTDNDGGADGAVVTPPGCDLAKTPKESAQCVTNDVGVFVDATAGDDQKGDGTKEHPFKTIGFALGKLAGKPRVYVCQGRYPEDVVLDTGHAASLIGGLECGDWAYNAASVPVIGAGNYPLRIAVPDRGILVSDVNVVAAPGKEHGASSIAALVANSKDVTFVRDVLTADKGVDGAEATPATVSFPDLTQLKGNDSTGNNGGPEQKLTTCPTGEVTIGGKGGDSGMPGDDGKPSLGAGNGGTAGSLTCSQGLAGNPGANGKDGLGASTLGTFSAGGAWTPAVGADGASGGVGQGGGGGGGFSPGGNSGGGGGGGAGGCGGPAGKGGGGGGSSAAIAVDASKVHVFASKLAAGDAGNGGNGAQGVLGMTDGGAKGNGSLAGCSGGNGGSGGSGGNGGGGAGGVSTGLLVKGLPAPDVDSATTSTFGKPGAAGSGASANTNDGIPGLAQAQVTIP